METDDTYYLAYTVCDVDDKGTDMKMEYWMVNPGGAELGTGRAPIAAIFLIYLIVWSVVTVIIVANMASNWRSNVALSKYILLVPLLMIAKTAPSYTYWRNCGATGYCETAVEAELLYSLAKAAVRVGLFHLLLLIAKGFCITRPRLERVEMKVMFCIIAALGVATFFANYIGGFVGVGLLIVYIAVIWFIFGNINISVRALNAQLHLIAQAGVDPRSTPAHVKLAMFVAFQKGMTSYVFADFLNYFISGYFFQHMAWVSILVEEALDLFIFAVVAYTFRLRKFSPYTSHVPESSPNTRYSPLDSDMTDVSGNVEDGNGSNALQQWQMGQPLPAVPNGMLQYPAFQPAPVRVVVQNPGQGLDDVAVGTVLNRPDHGSPSPAPLIERTEVTVIDESNERRSDSQ